MARKVLLALALALPALQSFAFSDCACGPACDGSPASCPARASQGCCAPAEEPPSCLHIEALDDAVAPDLPEAHPAPALAAAQPEPSAADAPAAPSPRADPARARGRPLLRLLSVLRL